MTGWAHSGWETRLNPEGEDDFWESEVEAGARQRWESAELAKITGRLRVAVGEGRGEGSASQSTGPCFLVTTQEGGMQSVVGVGHCRSCMEE